MSVGIKGGSSTTNVVNVNAEFEMAMAPTRTADNAGFVCLAAENDAGTITGSRYVRAIEASEDFRLRAGTDTPLFTEVFAGAAFNTALWTTPVTTMTATVANNFANLNAGLSTASGAVARLTSYQQFPILKTFTTYCEMEVQFTQLPQASNVCEWGLFLATGVAAPTDGAFFRLDAAASFVCVVVNNSVETVSSALTFSTLVGTNDSRQFLIYIGSTVVRFWIDNVLVAVIPTPSGQGSSIASMSVPMTARNRNTGVTAAAQVLRVGNVNVTLGDALSGKQWGAVMAGMGRSLIQGQTGGTMGSLANYANSANPVAAVPTNTTAALGVGLGGQFWETDTLAVTTDGIICSYQNPAGTAALPGKNLYITGVEVDSFVQTVLTGGGYVAQWGLAIGHTAVSLATAEGVGTKAPRRVPLGLQTVAAAAAALTLYPKLAKSFPSTAIVVYPGEFVAVVKKKIGTAPSAGVIGHIVTFTGYQE